LLLTDFRWFISSCRRRSSALLDVAERLSPAELDRVMTGALFEAMSWCEEHFGKSSEQWRWGQVHQAQYTHPSVPVRILL
jgi:acyl-homoserine lactone acylase PvdQ